MTPEGQPIGVWQTEAFLDPIAMAICDNAVVVAGELAPPEGSSQSEPAFAVSALSITDGSPLWSETLQASPVPWGLAIDRFGSALVTLIDGTIVCVAEM